ncbi:DNA polymerase zeta catalytic subunit [Anopheles aquasalis]|uniref:DNA polymerase zeta catalytic subunit n=1 Tax=Anopheles aquasalis TaxID=42839 RepID=UPI00215B00B0|nr:DNA polymerase zeta catalytic subunit [Anopheles aquasalis]
MPKPDGTTSIRIVSVDFYLSKPDPQFDVCRSEFRGSEIKQVPVVRLFGSSSTGVHSCVHIHGVFPYFYIPYEGSVSDRLVVGQRIYQLATALDKALNVSLAQSNSRTIHVFNISLVKGIPIYGYHKQEHHFLKIYLFNPLLVRKATQLLMNGAILSTTYQVLETHVPYILQFFIDYNLYGMSFLNLESKGLRQRKDDGSDPPKMSTSEYEIDALATAILNRAPHRRDTSEFANPGIASIWADEQARRQLFGMEQPERLNLSQDSGPTVEVVTESDRFYRALLVSKLLKQQTAPADAGSRKKVPCSAYPSEVAEGENLMDASFIANHTRSNQSSQSLYSSQMSYHFDTSSCEVDEEKILSMSQNPDVTLDEDDMRVLEMMRALEENENQNFEGDCLLAPLSQRSGEINRSAMPVMLNLSQANKRLNASLCGDLEAVCLMNDKTENSEHDASFDSSDDEFLLDLTQKQNIVENDGDSEYLSDSGDLLLVQGGLIPQLDGGDDTFSPRTSKRERKSIGTIADGDTAAKRARSHLNESPAKLTPRRVSFANPISLERDEIKRGLLLSHFEASSPNTLKECIISLPRLDLSSEYRLTAGSSSPDSEEESTSNTSQPSIPLKEVYVRLDRLPSPYELESPTASNRGKRLNKSVLSLKPKHGPPRPKRPKYEPQEVELVLSEQFKNIIRLSPKVLIKPLLMPPGTNFISLAGEGTSKARPVSLDGSTGDGDSKDTVEPENEVMEAENATVSVSLDGSTGDGDSKDTVEPENEVMEAENATVSIIDVPETPPDLSLKDPVQSTAADEPETVIDVDGSDEGNGTAANKPVQVDGQVDGVMETTGDSGDDNKGAEGLDTTIALPVASEQEEDEEEDANIHSFCEKTLVCELDDINMDSDDESFGAITPMDDGEEGGANVWITPSTTAPTYADALKAIETFEIPAVVNPTPFYSDPDDVSGKKEVGHTVLHIPGNSLNDVAEFRSAISGLASLTSLRYNNLKRIYGDDIHQVLGSCPNADRMKELLVSDALVHITPSYLPPSCADAKLWITTKCRSRQNEENPSPVDAPEMDSPVKVKKAETIMAIEQTQSNDGMPTLSGETKIDSESSLNLSVLVTTGDTEGGPKNGSHPKTLVSKIMAMNSLASPSQETNDEQIEPEDKSDATSNRLNVAGYNAHQMQNKLIYRRRLSLKGSEEVQQPDADNGDDHKGSDMPATDEDVIDTSQIDEQLLRALSGESARTIVQEESDLRNYLHQQRQCPSVSPLTLPPSDQSHLVEHSNANISVATPLNNTYGFKVDYENLQNAKPTNTCEYNYLTILSLEIHVQTRGDLRPNPNTDPIAAIFYRIHNDVPPDHPRASSVCGIILNQEQTPHGDGNAATTGYKYNQCPYVADVVVVQSERELYEKFLLLIAFWDPDIFAGYEIESVSWGYVIERGYVLEMNLMKMLSRVPTLEKVHVSEEEQQELLEMHEYSAGLKIPGRILLDIWRLMRHEIALTSYTFENVVYHILHRRVPCHSYRQLTRVWAKPCTRWIVLDYYLERVNGNFAILHQLDLIGRTAELAKLFGIQFYEVLSRGSQFRVESMMLRIAKPGNFVSVSPSIQQRAHMRAPEYLPLIMEPNSRFYADPIIVLDFQSLYPSVIIAYNYCFSTCLGRVEHLGSGEESVREFEFGASHLRVPRKMLQALLDKNLITCSPCGVAFVKKRVREGVLPRMLSEILNTRLMVKKSMKLHKDNTILQRVLHSRQLGLKLIANVTYGYTAANFSGRMPCVEIGDSVVAKGRETLERAIKLVEDTERWGAKVVYGDTDSLFVLCPGRTKAEAFKIGEEIAAAVTAQNPPPVKLKLEKVYQPSILQTKKRYVGYMYESADQEKPTYEAKGIETVRRDGCPVVAKMLEKVLRILFETCDVSKVKQYTCRQFTKILEGRVNLQDFIFAKEFRGEDGYKPGACVPSLELTRKWKLTDPRREPRRGQRVPYVIINGPPLVPLIRLVRSPDEMLANEGLKINANYYILKAIIPPLNRCLLLIGADVNRWFNELPRKTLMLHNTGGMTTTTAGAATTSKMQVAISDASDQQQAKKSTISQYFSTTSCIVDCGRKTHNGVCKECRNRPQYALVHIMNKVNKLERRLEFTEKMCRSCCQRTFESACISLDCPVVFSLNRRQLEVKQAQYYRDLVEQMF